MPAATSTVEADGVPVKMPCKNRTIKSCVGVRTKAVTAIITAVPMVARTRFGLRPKRSPSAPQIGVKMAKDTEPTDW